MPVQSPLGPSLPEPRSVMRKQGVETQYGIPRVSSEWYPLMELPTFYGADGFPE